MTRDHTTIEALLAIQALDGLDGDDVQLLANEQAAHGACAECRRLEAGFSEVASSLAFTLDPVDVDPAMADRILASTVDEVARVDVATGVAVDPTRHPERRTTRRWQGIVAIAAALAAIVVAASLLRPGTTSFSAASPSQQIVRFDGAGDADLVMAYTPGTPGAVFWGSNIPDVGAEQAYEIWMIQDGEPISGGCVQPQDGTIALSVDADIGTAEFMAVTVEDATCPGAPTSDPVLRAQLPAVV